MSVSTGIDADSLTNSSPESDMVGILSSSAEDRPYLCPQYAAPSSIPSLPQMPFTTGLEEKLSQTAHLEGKSSVLPGTGFVMSTATKTGTKGILDITLGPPEMKQMKMLQLPISTNTKTYRAGYRGRFC